MRALFVVASDPLRAVYLEEYPDESFTLGPAELVSVHEKPWEELREIVCLSIRHRPNLARVRVAGHLSTCFRKTRENLWQEAFPELAAELRRTLGGDAPSDIEVWGFGHDPRCRIWAVLSRITDALSGTLDPGGYAEELHQAYRPAEPEISQAGQIRLLRHNLRGSGTVVLQQLRTAAGGTPEFYEKAAAGLPGRMVDARKIVARLYAATERLADADRRERARAAIMEVERILDEVPTVTRGPGDVQAFAAWEERLGAAASALTDDLFL